MDKKERKSKPTTRTLPSPPHHRLESDSILDYPGGTPFGRRTWQLRAQPDSAAPTSPSSAFTRLPTFLTVSSRMTATATRRVSYVHSPELQKVGDALPSNLGRSTLVHSLISSYGLIDDGQDTSDGQGGARAKIVEPIEATRQEFLSFHDEDFIGSSGSLLSRHSGY